MSEQNPYFDKRTDFFKQYFGLGLDYEKFVTTGSPEQQARWNKYADQIHLSNEQLRLMQSFRRKINVIVLAGVWCGDCARQCPMFHAIEGANSLFSFRFLDNNQHPELQDELRINGAKKVPVVLSLSEDFFELNRFGDKHLSVYRKKAAQEMGAACDAGLGAPEDELNLELTEWIAHFERIQLLLRLAPMLRRRYND